MSWFDRLLIALGLKKRPRPTPVPEPEPVPSPTRTVIIRVTNESTGTPVVNAKVRLDEKPAPYNGQTDEKGEVTFTVGSTLKDSHVDVWYDLYKAYSRHVDITDEPVWVYNVSLTPIVVAKLAGRVYRQGRFLYNDKGVHRICGVSALTILTKSPAEQKAFLEWAVKTGFNLVRIFAGHLEWAGQTAASARAALDAFLTLAASYGLYVEVTIITDSAIGNYDIREHVRLTTDICRRHANNVLVELANETFHPTQDERIHDVQYLLGLWREFGQGLTCALGAPDTDEPHPGWPVADYLTLHLDRGRDKWNQVRRVRELELASRHMDCPVLNNEPIGADEWDGSVTGKQRINDPSFFFTLGVLNRLFEVHGIYHAQHGLKAELPGPVQQTCADAYVRGWKLIDTDAQVRFRNAGWSDADAPIASGNFDGGCIRAYSGLLSDTKGVCVVLGITGDPQLVTKNGWVLGRVLDEMPGVKVYELTR